MQRYAEFVRNGLGWFIPSRTEYNAAHRLIAYPLAFTKVFYRSIAHAQARLDFFGVKRRSKVNLHEALVVSTYWLQIY